MFRMMLPAVVTLLCWCIAVPCQARSRNSSLESAVRQGDLAQSREMLHAEGSVTDIAIVEAAVTSANPTLYSAAMEHYVGDIGGDACRLMSALIEASPRGANKSIQQHNQMIDDKLTILEDIIRRSQANPVCSSSTLSDYGIRHYGNFKIYKKIFDSNIKFRCLGDPRHECGTRDSDKQFSSDEEKKIQTALIKVIERYPYGIYQKHLIDLAEYEKETQEYLQYCMQSKNIGKIRDVVARKIGSIIVGYLVKKDATRRKFQGGDVANDNKSINNAIILLSNHGSIIAADQYKSLKEKMRDLDNELKRKNSNMADVQLKLDNLQSTLAVIDKYQKNYEGDIAQNALNTQLAEASRGLDGGNPIDAKVKLLHLLGKGADPATPGWGAGTATVTWNILKRGDLDLVKGLVRLQRERMSLHSSGGDLERLGFVEFAVENKREDVAVFLVESGFNLMAKPEAVLLAAARNKFRHLTKLLLGKGASPEHVLADLLGDEESAETVLAVSGERQQHLRAYYREKQQQAAAEQARLLAAAAEAVDAHQKAKAKRQAEEQERFERLARQPKSIGQKICLKGKMLFSEVTVAGFVENMNGSRMQIRIVDTGSQGIRYHDMDLRQGTIIWDEQTNWIDCKSW